MSNRIKGPQVVAIAHPMGLGDTTAALPMAGAIKRQHPDWKVIWLGYEYTRALVGACRNVDLFIDADHVLKDPLLLKKHGVTIFLNPYPQFPWSKAAFKAGVPIRVGNLRRLKMLPWCNRFIHNSRFHSKRHEVATGLYHLKALGLRWEYPREEWPALYNLVHQPQKVPAAEGLDHSRFNLVLHMKSNGLGREWPLGHYLQLARRLLPTGKFRLWVTGSEKERALYEREAAELLALPEVHNVAGRFSQAEFLDFLGQTDGIVASGTGPLHIMAALGKHACGIFPPRDQGISPRYWAPIGPKAEVACLPEQCLPGPGKCAAKGHGGGPCACTIAITPEEIAGRVLAWVNGSIGMPA